MNATELVMQRRQTAAMIRADPTSVTLTRYAWTATAGGGRVRGPGAALPVQKFHIIPDSQPTRQRIAVAEGVVDSADYWLLGRHDADVAEGDEFTLGGRWYAVRSVLSDRTYRTIAAVKERDSSG